MQLSVLVLSALLLGAAGDSSSTVEAWQAYQSIQIEYRKVASEAVAKYRQAVKNGADRSKALADYRAATSPLTAKSKAAKKIFADAFANSDWNQWAVSEHQAMLAQGLPIVAKQKVEDGDLDAAAKAYKMLIDKTPATGTTKLSLGDILAAQGNIEGALALYKQVVEQKDQRSSRYANQRLALVGKPAPDIDSKTWIGGQAKSLSAMKGKVVVIDFWATWCGPCRHVMPAFSKLYTERNADGLVIMGLTRQYPSGYLPADPSQMISGGKRVTGLNEENFVEHITAFRDNTKMSYPFVVGQADDFKNYQVFGIPTVAVVDTKGKIALLVVGSGTEGLIKAVVDRELGKSKK